MNNFEIKKPFGPSIVKAKIPEKIVKDLNTYIDKIIANEKKSDELNFGKKLIGDVTQEFKLENDGKEEIATSNLGLRKPNKTENKPS